ncbi:MAG: 2-oxoglutarate and iron-dependent oxygenase domain-containing protein [Pseudomonadota bacterium]|nr:2-oxoglutarate and iron-dependent oxygenase domain-containing protein [Pseudomonadota bacterium]
MSNKNKIETGVETRKVSDLTPGLTSIRMTDEEIPVIDLAPMRSDDASGRARLAKEISRACEEIGFFYVKNHGIPDSVITDAQRVSKGFFEQSEGVKKLIEVSSSSSNRGYIPLYGEKNSSVAKGDLKETFDMSVDVDEDDPLCQLKGGLYGPNQWPESPRDFKAVMMAYFEEMTGLSRTLYDAFAQSLDLEPQFFSRHLSKPLDICRLLQYPSQEEVLDEEQIGTGAHSDFDCFTILWQDANGGLQALRRDGIWIDALPIPNTLLVNVGDMLQRWTNGKFVSTVHRVITRSGNERNSMVFFAAPEYKTVIECIPSCLESGEVPKHQPVTSGEYIVSRYEEVLI